jgi:hypothetical protein
VVQVATERKMKWKDDKPKFIPIKTKRNIIIMTRRICGDIIFPLSTTV